MAKARTDAPQRCCRECDGLIYWTKGRGWEHAGPVLPNTRPHRITPVVEPQMPKPRCRKESKVAVYEGKRGHNVTRNGIALDLAPSLKLWKHSPSGFSWGYGGSGPAQLALALLLDATGDAELSVRLHQTFKWAFVAGWPVGWRITSERIRGWVDEHRAADEEAPDAKDPV